MNLGFRVKEGKKGMSSIEQLKIQFKTIVSEASITQVKVYFFHLEKCAVQV